MASPQVGSIPAKLSFAKVAAMRAPAGAGANHNPSEEKKPRPFENSNQRNPIQPGVLESVSLSAAPKDSPLETLEDRARSEYVANAIQGLSLVKAAPILPDGPQSAESGESLEDDQSHLSNSSSKQQSFDTKSMASVTTFAMDEKESIRPDDSASVRAAEDDETSSAAPRDMSFQRDLEPLASHTRTSSRPNTSGVTIAARRYHTLTLTNPPRFGDLPAPVVQPETPSEQTSAEALAEQGSDPHERASSLPIPPDEKLLDALATPKDRLPLLQLEDKFLTFMANSESEFLDLPPQNSFARLLAHKLADYYSLAHLINEDGTSIRIFKTPNVSMPTPLHVLAMSIPAGPSQPVSAISFKIMRRAGLGRQGSAGASTPASSSVPSKATSEAGLETTSEEGFFTPADGTPNKDKHSTLAEREAKYKAARERIFGDFQESVASDGASTGENSASLSRSSSSSGKRKPRKTKTPRDDSFEARSAFVPSYAPMNVQQIQPQYQPHFAEQAYQGSYQGSASGYGPGNNYSSTPTQSYPNFDPSMSYNGGTGYGPSGHQAFSPAESWSSLQSPSNYFQYPPAPNSYQQNISPIMPQMNNQFIQQPHPSMAQPQNWVNGQFQAPYPQQQIPPNPGMNGWTGYQPSPPISNPPNYGYGQPSGQTYAGNPNHTFNTQYSAPNNFSRSLFNPQTRSFVPSNAPSRAGGRVGRKKPLPSPSQGPVNTIPKPYIPDVPVVAHFSPPRGFERGPGGVPASKPKEDSLQQKYGAPAHLPKKPPPSQVPSSFDVESIGGNPALGSGPPALNVGSVGTGGGGVGGSSNAGGPATTSG